ncbi:MAG: peroxiredoxin [Planctomycetaceae bacterium]|jgi:alkyl hydroperoxide reductase subunit AhpC|nr:peroxiredoxin [Planctomycetaceae bacterium]
MSVLVQKPAPDFKAQAVMPNGTFKEISISEYTKAGKYVVLFFYPMDFTFVCPTEIIAFSEAASEFEKLNVQLLGCSVDSEFTHLAWINTSRKDGGLGELKYPLVSDITKKISESYDVLIPDAGVALRGLFLIDKSGIVRHQIVNDLPLGRNVDEALRLVKALQFVEKYGEVCPANWQEGKSGMKADPQGSKTFFAATYK